MEHGMWEGASNRDDFSQRLLEEGPVDPCGVVGSV